MRPMRSAINEETLIPLTVVGGSVGAGKSTLVRHLLDHADGRRLAAILPDLRSIDSTCIASHDGAFVTLVNGCTCVIDDGEVAPALAGLAQLPCRPERVIVEGSGRADPRRFRGYGYMPGYRLDGTIAVVDASVVASAQAMSDDDLSAQVRAADVVVMNKLDLAGEHDTTMAHARLEWLAPEARVVWSDHARVAPPLLIGLANGPDGLDGRAILAQWSDRYSPIRNHSSKPTRGDRAQRGDRCRSWCLVNETPLESRAFRDWVNRLPAAIVRGDGVVYLREEPQHRYAFHLFGSHWRLERSTPWQRDTPSTRLLLAGLGAAWRATPRRVSAVAARSSIPHASQE